MRHESTQQVLYGGGQYYSNPADIAEQERRSIWPDVRELEPDVFVSLGGALHCAKGDSKSRSAQRKHAGSAMDPQQTWEQWIYSKRLEPDAEKRYIRIDPELNIPPSELDAYDQIEKLQDQTESLLRYDPLVKDLACRLAATTFYFQPSADAVQVTDEGDFEIKGA